MTLGLTNIERLLHRLGDPHHGLRTAVVAGTNGKGSVTAMLASILRESGLRVGRFISPHVYSVTERIAIDDHPVSIEELDEAATSVAALERDLEFSYFEALVAMACLLFARHGVDVVVFEVGLGGRLDATNVTAPDVAVITSISLDHRRLLGDTMAEILLEKYGVARTGTPLLVGPLDTSLEDSLVARARRDGVPVELFSGLGEVRVEGGGDGMIRRTEFGRNVRICTPRADYGLVRVPFSGYHQAANALLAVAASERLLSGEPVPVHAIEQSYLPARFEPFDLEGRRVILDVAHNDAALRAVARSLMRVSSRDNSTVVFGLMKRKELFDAPRALLDAARRVITIQADAGSTGAFRGAAYSAAELHARFIHPQLTDRRVDAIVWNHGGADGWNRLVEYLAETTPVGGTILAAGSHHVAAGIGRALWSSGAVPASAAALV